MAPPPTVPTVLSSGEQQERAPGRWGVEPAARTTVARAPRWPEPPQQLPRRPRRPSFCTLHFTWREPPVSQSSTVRSTRRCMLPIVMTVRFVVNGQACTVATRSTHTTSPAPGCGLGLHRQQRGMRRGRVRRLRGRLRREGRRQRDRASIRSIAACVPLARSMGVTVITVEGVADPAGRCTRCSRRWSIAGGSQCGYCTPGFVVSLFCEYYRPGRAAATIPRAIGGNLCRCTGYRPIADAARAMPVPDRRHHRAARVLRRAARPGALDHSATRTGSCAPRHSLRCSRVPGASAPDGDG